MHEVDIYLWTVAHVHVDAVLVVRPVFFGHSYLLAVIVYRIPPLICKI